MKVNVKYSKRRKTIALEVKVGGEIWVHCPYGTTQESINIMIEKHKQWLEKAVEKQISKVNSHMKREISADEETALRQKAMEILPERIKYYGAIMDLHPNRITITGAKTRFGSCSPQNNISFSFRLMLYPKKAIDYVVVHELAHIKEKNHQKPFYDIVASVMPDYKECEAMLKNDCDF